MRTLGHHCATRRARRSRGSRAAASAGWLLQALASTAALALLVLAAVVLRAPSASEPAGQAVLTLHSSTARTGP